MANVDRPVRACQIAMDILKEKEGTSREAVAAAVASLEVRADVRKGRIRKPIG